MNLLSGTRLPSFLFSNGYFYAAVDDDMKFLTFLFLFSSKQFSFVFESLLDHKLFVDYVLFEGNEVLFGASKLGMLTLAFLTEKHLKLINVILTFIPQLTIQFKIFDKIAQYFYKSLVIKIIEEGVDC